MIHEVVPVSQPIKAFIEIPGSKSLTNRALLLAALAHGESILCDILISDDTLALIHALRSLGIIIQVDVEKSTCRVWGSGGQFPVKNAVIHCHDAGTVARFLLAAAAASEGYYTFEGSSQLSRRPLGGLVHALQSQGVRVSASDGLPLSIWGVDGLPGGVVDILASASGQFVSGLLMAAPLSHHDMLIKAHSPVSGSFIEMTIKSMRLFGVAVDRMDCNQFYIKAPQQYVSTQCMIEPDASTAANFFAAAAITHGQVTVQPINLDDSLQGDFHFLQLLQKMGCRVQSNANGLTVYGAKELVGIDVDMQDCSDTFMALAALAPFAKTSTTIKNIAHTRKQESNRIEAMSAGLRKLGVRTEQGEDWLKIYPSRPKWAEIDSYGDHRIAMAFSVIGLKTGVMIRDAECVAKTCPTFFTLWNKFCVN